MRWAGRVPPRLRHRRSRPFPAPIRVGPATIRRRSAAHVPRDRARAGGASAGRPRHSPRLGRRRTCPRHTSAGPGTGPGAGPSASAGPSQRCRREGRAPTSGPERVSYRVPYPNARIRTAPHCDAADSAVRQRIVQTGPDGTNPAQLPTAPGSAQRRPVASYGHGREQLAADQRFTRSLRQHGHQETYTGVPRRPRPRIGLPAPVHTGRAPERRTPGLIAGIRRRQ